MELKINNLTIGYRANAPLHCNINYSAQSGEAIALIGSNGTGKSTLLRTIASLLKPLSGEVLLDGQRIHTIHPARRAKLLSYVSTEPIGGAYTTVRQVVELGRIPYSTWAGKLSMEDRAIVEDALRRTDTEEFAERRIDTLSDGQRQRVLIARALAQSTPLIVLDEPTAFLDPENRLKVIKLLGELSSVGNKIVIYSTHEVEIARECSSAIWQL
ncbi:MAG: ABC transporter ATP-binding protein [Rikenellaceae bacterium]